MPGWPSSNPPKESQRLAPAGVDSLAPKLPSENLDCDIADELADHLSLSARDLQLTGYTPEEAHQLAHQKFGDVTAIRRRLWWIQKGDEIMLRAALAVVLVVVVLAVAALGVGGWQISQTMNELGDTLAEISAAQKASLQQSRQPDRGLAIQGRLYVGDRSTPASFSEVHLYHLPDMKLTERLSADKDGRFATAPLPPGQYFVIAPLVGESNQIVAQREPLDRSSLFVAQSAPINVYPWSSNTNVEMDLKMFPVGEVTFELTRDVLFQYTPGEMQKRSGRSRTFETLLYVIIPTEGVRLPESNVWRPDMKWLLIGAYNYVHTDVQGYRNSDRNRNRLVVGKPNDFDRLHGAESVPVFRPGTYEAGAFLRIVDFAMIGEPATSTALPPARVFSELPPDEKSTFSVVDGRRAHLRLTPPDNFEAEVRSALDAAHESPEKLQSVYDRIWPMKVEFLGQHDIDNQD